MPRARSARSVRDPIQRKCPAFPGQEEDAFAKRDPREAAAVVRAMVDGLFIQWIQDKNGRDSHEQCRETCKRAVLAYLTSGT